MLRNTLLLFTLVGLLGLATPVSASADPTIAVEPVHEPDCWVGAAPTVAGCTVGGFGPGCRILDGGSSSDGWIGASCGVYGMSCTQAHWGHHGSTMFAGGYNGCHAAVAVHKSALSSPPACTMTLMMPSTLTCTGPGWGVSCTPAAVGTNHIVTQCTFSGDACPPIMGFHTDGRPVTTSFMNCQARIVAENPSPYIAPIVNI